MDFLKELGEFCPKAKQGAKIYFFGRGNYFEQLRAWYRGIALINIEDYAFAFIDDDVNRHGKNFFYGKDVVGLDSVCPDDSVILAVTNINGSIVGRKIINKGFKFCNDFFSVWDGILKTLYTWTFRNSMKFKDKHYGERCFIVGNGPSLSLSDLNMLINEKTFAMNRIYKIFDKTVWRPTYYSFIDSTGIKEVYCDVLQNIKCCKFFDIQTCCSIIDIDKKAHFENTFFLQTISSLYRRPNEYIKPLFGEFPDTFWDGGTIAYTCLQLAAFMGFKEIYMIGFDAEYKVSLKCSGEYVFTEKRDYFTDDYICSSSNIIHNIPRLEHSNFAYQSAREYAESHGITIKNATRGGKLEVFERIDFDSLF